MYKLIIISFLLPFVLFAQNRTIDETPYSEQEAKKTTAAQDSAFREALQDDVPNFLRFKESLFLLDLNQYMNRTLRNNPWAAAQKNLAEIPDEYYQPSGNEIILHQDEIMASQYIPGFNNWPQYNGGFSMPLSAIGSFLGIKEDVSPTINFSLDFADEVEIVVYSVQAVVISTVFSGRLTAGSYTRTWNGRNDDGKKMPKGDYIIEVRIGKSRYIRKRVKL